MSALVLLFALAGVLLLGAAGFGAGSARFQPGWLGLACLAVAVVLLPAFAALPR